MTFSKKFLQIEGCVLNLSVYSPEKTSNFETDSDSGNDYKPLSFEQRNRRTWKSESTIKKKHRLFFPNAL